MFIYDTREMGRFSEVAWVVLALSVSVGRSRRYYCHENLVNSQIDRSIVAVCPNSQTTYVICLPTLMKCVTLERLFVDIGY